MGFIDGFKRGLVGPEVASAGLTTKASPDSLIQGNSVSVDLSGMLTGSGPQMRGAKELLSYYRENPTLRKVVSLIANELASTEFFLGKAASQRRARSKAMRISKAAQTADTRVDEHPFLDFLYSGNPVMPGPSGMKLSWIYYLIKGEFFWLIAPNEDGTPGWVVIPPHWVEETPESKGRYTIRIGTKLLNPPPEFVLWVRDPDVVNPFSRGAGHGDSLRDELDTDEYASQLMRYTMANKGMMEGVLSVEHASAESLTHLRRDFEAKHRGASNSGKTLVVDGSAVKYTPLSQAFSELKLLELREAEKTMIEEQFSVPPELFGKVENSNRATITLAQEIFARNKLIPLLNLFTIEVGLRLLPYFDPQGTHYLTYESPLPSDDERSLELMKAAPHAFSANEFREAAGLGAEPWGDVRYIEARYLEVPAPKKA